MLAELGPAHLCLFIHLFVSLFICVLMASDKSKFINFFDTIKQLLLDSLLQEFAAVASLESIFFYIVIAKNIWSNRSKKDIMIIILLDSIQIIIMALLLTTLLKRVKLTYILQMIKITHLSSSKSESILSASLTTSECSTCIF